MELLVVHSFHLSCHSIVNPNNIFYAKLVAWSGNSFCILEMSISNIGRKIACPN
jgi:hypothetical protein